MLSSLKNSFEMSMLSKLVTFERVAEAAQQLTDAGQKPTVRAVMAALGGGSPNAVLPLLNQWKKAAPALAYPEIVLDPAIVQLLTRQIAAATLNATAATTARLEELQADADLLAEAGQLAEQRAVQLQSDLNDARASLQLQAGQLEARASDLAQLKTECAQQVALAQTKVEQERQAAETVRQALVRAHIRVEAVPRFELEIADLKDRLRQAEQAVALARQEAAVSLARFDAESSRVQEFAEREKAVQAQLQRQDKELAAGRAQERLERDRAQKIELALRQQLAGLERKTTKSGTTTSPKAAQVSA